MKETIKYSILVLIIAIVGNDLIALISDIYARPGSGIFAQIFLKALPYGVFNILCAYYLAIKATKNAFVSNAIVGGLCAIEMALVRLFYTNTLEPTPELFSSYNAPVIAVSVIYAAVGYILQTRRESDMTRTSLVRGSVIFISAFIFVSLLAGARWQTQHAKYTAVKEKFDEETLTYIKDNCRQIIEAKYCTEPYDIVQKYTCDKRVRELQCGKYYNVDHLLIQHNDKQATTGAGKQKN